MLLYALRESDDVMIKKSARSGCCAMFCEYDTSNSNNHLFVVGVWVHRVFRNEAAIVVLNGACVMCVCTLSVHLLLFHSIRLRENFKCHGFC